MFLKKKNQAKTFINKIGGITATDLSMFVEDATQLPNAPEFLLTIWDQITFPDPYDDPNIEIVKVTNIVANTLTILRSQEDTVGKIHPNGSTVANLITAGTFEEIENEINILSPGRQVDNEELTSQIDGLTNSFTTIFNYISGTLKVYVGGKRQIPGAGKDYIETGLNSFDLNYIPASTEKMIVDYTKN